MSNSGYRSLAPQTPRFMMSASFPGESSGLGSSGSSSSAVKQANPFVTNPHGHPSFNPAKLGSKSGGDSKTPKQPKPPDKPLMPYMRYSRKVSRLVWESVKANNPDLKLWEIGKIIGQMWRELSEEEKQQYIDEYEAEKVQYMDAMKAYHSSQAYQSWIVAKGKVDVDAEQEEPEKSRRSKAPPPPPPPPMEQRVMSIQPAEEDDDLDDSLSVKHVATVRYLRNHWLINEVFSDAVVPDIRAFVSEARMSVLKRQVHSLTMHQKKLEGDLQQIDDKHHTKRQKFAENSEHFYTELKNLCNSKPQITDEQFNLMILRAKEEQRDKQRTMLQKESPNQLEEKKNEETALIPEQNISGSSELAAVSAAAAAAAGETASGIDKPPENEASPEVPVMETDIVDVTEEIITGISTNSELSAFDQKSQLLNIGQQQPASQESSAMITELLSSSVNGKVHKEVVEMETRILKESNDSVEVESKDDTRAPEKSAVFETPLLAADVTSNMLEETSQPDQTVPDKTDDETPNKIEDNGVEEMVDTSSERLDTEIPEILQLDSKCEQEDIDGRMEQQEINEVETAEQSENESTNSQPEKPECLVQCEPVGLQEHSDCAAVVEPPTQTMVPEWDTMPETSIARESAGDGREHTTSTTE